MKKLHHGWIWAIATVFAVTSTSAHGANTPEKHHVIVLALDCSGSMKRSDPERRRLAAAQLVLAAANSKDDVGVLGFGDQAKWLGQDDVTARAQYDLHALEGINENQQHTDFAGLLVRWVNFLNTRPEGYFDTHDVSLVILTDGQPDAPGQTATENAAKTLSLAAQAAQRSAIYTIGLGPESQKTEFLQNLAAVSHGRHAYASTDKELADAFLQVATAVLGSPVFQRMDHPGRIQNFGNAEESRLILIGGSGLSAQGAIPILTLPSLQVFDAAGVQAGGLVDWQGSGTLFYCRRQQLSVVMQPPLPPAMLLAQKLSEKAVLTSDSKSIRDAYFLQGAELQVKSSEQGSGNNTVQSLALHDQAFRGELAFPDAGKYALTAHLSALYGKFDQSLGTLEVSSTAVDLPQQITMPVFPGIPRAWLPLRVPLHLLPVLGSATVRLDEAENSSAHSLLVLPGRPVVLTLVAPSDRAGGEIWNVPYTVVWADGVTKSEQHAVLRVALRPMTLGELFRALWVWLAGALGLALIVTLLLRRLAPRSLRGKLQIVENGRTVYSVLFPDEWKTGKVELYLVAGVASIQRKGTRLEIPASESGALCTFTSERRKGRWTTVLTPAGPQMLQAGRTVREPLDLNAGPGRPIEVPTHHLTLHFR